MFSLESCILSVLEYCFGKLFFSSCWRYRAICEVTSTLQNLHWLRQFFILWN